MNKYEVRIPSSASPVVVEVDFMYESQSSCALNFINGIQQ